ncbi:MAG: hypothetical protein QMB03_07595 [Spirosomataceae bacterium]
MKKKAYVLLVLLLGIFIIPETVSACQKMSEEITESCEIDNSGNGEKQITCEKECCKKDDSEKASEQKHDCDGSCQGNCHQVVTHFNFALPTSTADIKYNADLFFRKDNFCFLRTQISSGFYFIWTPPNIIFRTNYVLSEGFSIL